MRKEKTALERLESAKKSFEEMEKELAPFSKPNKLVFVTGWGVWSDITNCSNAF